MEDLRGDRGVIGRYGNTQEEVQTLIRQSKPQFLYADTKDSRYYFHVIDSIKAMGVRLEEIPEASTARYRLFRMVGGGF